MDRPRERQLTFEPRGHILTNVNVFSPDGNWIVYDVRSDLAGSQFDGDRIERIHVHSGAIDRLYTSAHGACCGAATSSPIDERVVFMLGPENPTPEWSYAPEHRRGVIVRRGPRVQAACQRGFYNVANLDARDLVPPFTPGALRGGTHLHVFHPAGDWVSFTYHDHILARLEGSHAGRDLDQRNVGVCIPGPVVPSSAHPRNHPGDYFSFLVTRTTNQPRPGSDEISRACEEAWVGRTRALAFQGEVVSRSGQTLAEVFIVEVPEVPVALPSDRPLQGTRIRRPAPPPGTRQRRLTFSDDRRFPGIQGPRHWLRSSPDGSRIAFLMKDDARIVQIWTISPQGGSPSQLTRNPWPISSAFTWSPDGAWIACMIDNSIFLVDSQTGESRRMTPRSNDADAPRPEACVFAPDGSTIAYVRHLESARRRFNQIFVLDLHLNSNR